MAASFIHPSDDTPRLSSAVQVLAAISVAIVFLQWTVVGTSDTVSALGFQQGSLRRTLWSAFTYMFTHDGVWPLALNMYGLLAFGPRLEAVMGSRGFALYYLWCGLGGAIAHLIFARTGVLIGSTAAVLGVLYGSMQHAPEEPVYLLGVARVRASTMIILFAAASIGMAIMGSRAEAGEPMVPLAHLGGLALAWLYFRTPPAASIERLRQRISPAPDEQEEAPPRAIPRTLPRQRAHRDEVDEIVAKSKAIAAQQQTPTARALVAPARESGEQHALELNRVLDKISSAGLESLTVEERATLDDAARRLRGEGRP